MPTPPPSLLKYIGTLTHHAQARTSVLDGDGHSVPVLCLDVALDTAPPDTLLHVEQPFPEGHFEQCQAAAHRLKKGMHVSVQAPASGMHLSTRHATHIHVITTTEHHG